MMCEVEIFLLMSDAFQGVQFNDALTLVKPRAYLAMSLCFFLGAISHCLIAKKFQVLSGRAL